MSLDFTPPARAPEGWTFFSMAKNQPLYVILAPSGGGGPIPFPLPGLSREHRAILRALRRGDRVPTPIVQALLALSPESVLEEQLRESRPSRIGHV